MDILISIPRRRKDTLSMQVELEFFCKMEEEGEEGEMKYK
jgi:hypothetical protein